VQLATNFLNVATQALGPLIPVIDTLMTTLAQLIPQMMPFYEDKSPRPTYRFKTASAR